MNPELKVFIVDDDPGVCLTLKDLCQLEGLQTEIYQSALRFLAECGPERAGCLILDVKMSDMDGLELQQRLLERKSPIPIIFLSGNATVSQAVQATKRGAFDFLEKPFQNHVLINRVKQALAVAELIWQEQKKFNDLKEHFDQLTRREVQVLDMMVEGKTTKEIGLSLNISIKTVDFHRKNLMQKLHVDSLAQLVQMRLLFVNHCRT